ncbi:RNA polymerase sigma factor [Streptomyces sp. NPDC088394]|uniref:RNA polymerase sigma factor n=2 Tax=Streptomyces TaxID=1883 RepID=UPI0038253022
MAMEARSASASGDRPVAETSVALVTEALGALYRDHHREMEGFARRLLAQERLPESVLSAEDVVQTAFAKVLRAPSQIRDSRAYLYAVIRNDVRAASRQDRRRAVLASTAACQAQSADGHVADFSDLIANRLAVYKALRDLPSQQRTAVWATKALEYTQAETAEVMRKKPGTVATHVVRAVAALRVHLAALLVVGVMVFCMAGSRALRKMQPPAGSPRGPLPQTPSTSTWIYLAVSCLLVAGLARWVSKWWTRRRQAIEEGGTFAPRPITDQIRESFSAYRFNRAIRRDPPRQKPVPEEELSESGCASGFTRTRLPGR